MRTINVTIEGTKPLLLNRFTDAAQQAATSGTRIATIGDKGSPREQAEKKLYVSAQDDSLVMPTPNLFSCLMAGGKFFKLGRSKVTTQKSSLLPGCAEIEDVEVLIESKDGWDVDTRAVRIPATGGRVLAHRPCFNDWRISFVLQIDTDLMPIKLMREIVDAAGKRIGLGDFRPDCKGPFGRFVVVHWAIDEARSAA